MKLPGPNFTHLHYAEGVCEFVNAPVLNESTLMLMVNGAAWLNFLCTPIEQEELALGFLYNEGIIHSLDDVENIHICENGSVADVWLGHAAQPPSRWNRASGCTGALTPGDAYLPGKRLSADLSIASVFEPAQILTLMKSLYQSQDLYLQTRGLHCSALSDGECLLAVSEDIGRHNTLDKLAGKKLRRPRSGGLNHTPVVLTTGRITSEMILKSGKLGAELVVTRTSPSSMAVEFAREMGITLVGYVGHGEFNVYTFPERLGFRQVQDKGPP
jgi:FdhD protein